MNPVSIETFLFYIYLRSVANSSNQNTFEFLPETFICCNVYEKMNENYSDQQIYLI